MHLSDLNLFEEKGMEDWEKVSRSPSRAEKGKDKVAQDLTRRELEEENRRLRAQVGGNLIGSCFLYVFARVFGKHTPTPYHTLDLFSCFPSR